MTRHVRHIRVEPLTPEAYEPFGYVIGTPMGPPLSENAERSFWGSPELELVDGAFGVVYVEIRLTELVVRQLHRHRGFSQTMIPLGGKSLLHVVAPPGDVPDLTALRAFLVDGHQAVIIGRGTWHRNPAYALASSASLLLISRTETTRAAAATPGAPSIGGETDRVELGDLTDDEIRVLI